jgi:hypothetical protein
MTTAPRAYVDTCLISALIKNDVDAAELQALTDIFRRYQRGDLQLSCSPVVEEELAEIPADYRGPHVELLKQFASVPKATVGGITQMGPGGFGVANPRHRLWLALRAALPDEQDAWHVFVAARNRVRYLITVDKRTMLSRCSAVLEASGVELVSPSSFVAVAA